MLPDNRQREITNPPLRNTIEDLLENNRNWSKQIHEKEPDFFPKLAQQQSPNFLWIGCSDSRVPANQIVGLLPGELFVHRNLANIIYPSDLNCLSVVEYAVNVLQVRYIIVCGHYGCGGVKTAMEGKAHGIIDNWLIPIKDIYTRHRDDVHSLASDEKRLKRLCELNVIEQVKSLSHTNIIQNVWERGQQLAIHGWIYGLEDGLVKDLDVCIDRVSQVGPRYRFRREKAES
jgi:carbonic anhydrase